MLTYTHTNTHIKQLYTIHPNNTMMTVRIVKNIWFVNTDRYLP